jgi:predicted GNAT family N-acyltransferase
MKSMPKALYRIELGNWTELKDLAQPVRISVFVEEQNVPLEMEWDEYDEVSMHAVAKNDQGQTVGTGRLLPDGHVGRMAVMPSARGKGIGSAILVSLMNEAKRQGHREVILHAQQQAQAFYASHGFICEGSEFMEAGIPHIVMRHSFF